MRSMQFARSRAREERQQVGAAVQGLFDRLIEHLGTSGIDVIAVSPQQMEGSRAEVDAESGVIKYDETLTEAERLEVVAHELGHVCLHRRITDSTIPFDAVLASAYSEAGPAAIARYSPKTREEAEASAFALEFLCSSEVVFALWRADPEITFAALAERFEVTEQVVRVQLANALHDLTIGSDGVRASKSRNVTLTKEQSDAASFIGRPVLVDAGPGTGKTATLIGRVAFLLQDKGAKPEQILVLTFSNEAAQELSDRIADRFGRDIADRITVSTFHGLGMEFLHYQGNLLGFDGDPRLLDEDAQAEVLYQILGRVSCAHLITLYDPWLTAAKLVEHINHCKHHLFTADALAKEVQGWAGAGADPNDLAAAKEFAAIYRAYEQAKRDQQRVDFADLIMLPLQLLNERTDVRDAWRGKFPWVLVDEFQDVSRATSRLLRALCGIDNPPWVVGDARQAIYRFLGASPENVSEFMRDFPEAQLFHLAVNYRSSEPVIAAANQLASLMAPSGAQWSRGSEVQPLGKTHVSMAEADSDYAEQVGVVEQIKEWIELDKVSPGDIAVLARRHIDVRNTVLGLTAAGIKAQAAGLLTAEGAAGDLAVVLTLADAPAASIPRLAFALGQGQLVAKQLNGVITELLRRDREKKENSDTSGLIGEIARVRKSAEESGFSGDGWIALTTFLFESSMYLRRILDAPDTAVRAMTLVEVVSALSLATAYRATHPGVQPRAARLGFAERLRVRLTETVPLPIVPKPRGDVVRVMTCHASKGLEFPCVIVSGQTVPKFPEKYPWLPPTCRPNVSEDDEQANALLFVGVTRAQRAVVVSFPVKAGQGPRARGKIVVPLAQSWRATGKVPVRSWTATSATADRVSAGPVWGMPAMRAFKASALDSGICPILTYLESFLEMRFPEEEVAVYPAFFAAVRRTLRRIAQRANETGRQASELEVRAGLDDEWPSERFAEHPHVSMYYELALDFAMGFARAFRPAAGVSVNLEPELESLGGVLGPKVLLDLVAYFRQPDGRVVAVAFRPESFAEKAKEGTLGWSKLDQNKRILFVLANAANNGIMPRIYSGADHTIYDFAWSTRKDSLPTETAELTGRYRALAAGDFSTDASKFGCDRCRARVSCPHWIGALTD